MPSPLWKKLGYKEGDRACIIHPPAKYMDWVSPLPQGINFSGKENFNLVHIFTNDYEQFLEDLLLARERILQNGMIWVSWYKKASGLPSELNEDLIRQTALAHRLVDVKVCSINEHWSGLKLVIPVRYRSGGT